MSAQTVLLLKNKLYICAAVFGVTQNYIKMSMTWHMCS